MPVAAGNCPWRSWRNAPSRPARPFKGSNPVTPVSASAIYAGVLQALGLLDGLGQIADIGNDSVGQALDSARLPRHVHLRRPTVPSRHG